MHLDNCLKTLEARLVQHLRYIYDNSQILLASNSFHLRMFTSAYEMGEPRIGKCVSNALVATYAFSD